MSIALAEVLGALTVEDLRALHKLFKMQHHYHMKILTCLVRLYLAQAESSREPVSAQALSDALGKESLEVKVGRLKQLSGDRGTFAIAGLVQRRGDLLAPTALCISFYEGGIFDKVETMLEQLEQEAATANRHVQP